MFPFDYVIMIFVCAIGWESGGKGGGSSRCIPGISILDIVYSTSLTTACSEMGKFRQYTTVTTSIPSGDWYKSYYGLGGYLSQIC